MADREVVAVQIETDGAPIDAWELSYFLYLFRAAYVVACDSALWGVPSTYASAGEFSEYANHVLPTLSNAHGFQVASLARKRVAVNLTIVDIGRENPLEIIFGGIMAALAVAVIVSGGEFKGPGFQVKLPPLGTGIARLREAFGKKQADKKRLPRRKVDSER